jgi:hypothetical protein
MAGTANRLDRSLLYGAPAFSGLSGAELDDVLGSAVARRYAKGATVF